MSEGACLLLVLKLLQADVMASQKADELQSRQWSNPSCTSMATIEEHKEIILQTRHNLRFQ